MPNIASQLKAEIARVSRKELKADIDGLRKAVSAYRSEIAALKRRSSALEQQVKRLSRTTRRTTPEQTEEGAENLRFSAKGFATLRQKLGLSAREMSLLLGVSALSVYKWESGKAKPRAKQLPAIAGLRGLGKREAAKRLAAIAETSA